MTSQSASRAVAADTATDVAATATPVPGPRALFLNSAYSVAARGVAGLARVAVLLVIARKFGPAEFGEVALVVSVMEIFRTISEFGIDTISIRRFSQVSEDRVPETLRKIFGAKLLLAAISYVLCVIAVVAITRAPRTVEFALIVGLSLFTANTIGSFCSYLQSRFAMRHFLATTVWAVLLYVVSSVFAVNSGAALAAILVLLPASEAVNAFLLWRGAFKGLKFEFDLTFIRSLLLESLPVGIMAGLIIIYFRFDNIIVFRIAGESALGLYAAAYRLVEPALMIPQAFAITVYAVLTKRQHRRTASVVIHNMWPAYALIALGVVGCFTVGPKVLRLLSPVYLAAYPVLQVLAVTVLVRTANISFTAVLNSWAQYRRLAIITGMNLLLNISLALFLIPRFGILGAAYAALGTELWNAAAQTWSLVRLGPSDEPSISAPFQLQCE